MSLQEYAVAMAVSASSLLERPGLGSVGRGVARCDSHASLLQFGAP
jgi:hypothetical protein